VTEPTDWRLADAYERAARRLFPTRAARLLRDRPELRYGDPGLGDVAIASYRPGHGSGLIVLDERLASRDHPAFPDLSSFGYQQLTDDLVAHETLHHVVHLAGRRVDLSAGQHAAHRGDFHGLTILGSRALRIPELRAADAWSWPFAARPPGHYDGLPAWAAVRKILTTRTAQPSIPIST
jgi:hypothetical protein